MCQGNCSFRAWQVEMRDPSGAWTKDLACVLQIVPSFFLTWGDSTLAAAMHPFFATGGLWMLRGCESTAIP